MHEPSDAVGDSKAPPPSRPGTRAPPTTGELLVDPPHEPPGGSIAGYRAGRRSRVIFALVVLAVVGGGVWAYRWIRATAEAERNAPVVPSYAIGEDQDVTTRPRQLVWSSGPARLGLAREPPGVEEIVLPDRRIRLANGYDHAQIKIEVIDGRTTSLKVLVGDVVQLPLEDGPGSPPNPAATGP